MGDLSALYETMQVGPITVSNRMMMAGMSAGTKVDERGEVDPQMIAYYVERARGRPGMIAIGASPVVPPAAAPGMVRKPHGIQLYSDHVIPSLKRLTDSVHAFNVRMGIQLWNGGGTENGSGAELISPSGLSSNVRTARGDSTSRRRGQANRAMTLEDIEQAIEHFAHGAYRAAEAGFDFVEIHAGHGYLISNFLTPLFNRRTDRYGGSFENRTRFLLEIVAAVRKRVGQSIAVGLKYNGDDFLGEDGWTIEESRRLAPLAQQAGADYITVTAGLVGTPKLTIPPMYEPQGCYVDLAAAVKPEASVPIGTIGRIKDPLMARDIILSGKADFVCFARATIADPEIFGKIHAAKLEDVRPCLADCRGCIDEHILRHPTVADASCVVNPRMSRELDCVDVAGSAGDNPKRIVVIGGGLAGMEAARRTAFSGHNVTLLERRERLGGQLLLARKMPGRREIGDILPWYERQLAQQGVDVRVGQEADETLVRDLSPDVIILASGSRPAIPQNMMQLVMEADATELYLLDDLVENEDPLEGTVVVVGGDQNAMVVADYLAEKGCAVTVAGTASHFGQKLAAHDRWYLVNRQNARSVRRIKNVAELKFTDGNALSVTANDGEQEAIPDVAAIVFAGERKSERALLERLATIAEVRVIGDAHDAVSPEAGTIFATIAHAYDTARQI